MSDTDWRKCMHESMLRGHEHCTWEQIDEQANNYETLCGEERQLPRHLTPMTDGMSYCLFCGLPLVELLVSDMYERQEENVDEAE